MIFHFSKARRSANGSNTFCHYIFFVICNVPRIILNMEELVAVAPSYWKNYNIFSTQNTTQNYEEPNKPLCYSPPFWAHILRIISKLLLILNASVGCLVYCVICSTFQAEISNQFKKLMSLFITILSQVRSC